VANKAVTMTVINEQQYSSTASDKQYAVKSDGCNQKQHWLAAWEKAYLQNEMDSTKYERERSASEEQNETHRTAVSENEQVVNASEEPAKTGAVVFSPNSASNVDHSVVESPVASAKAAAGQPTLSSACTPMAPSSMASAISTTEKLSASSPSSSLAMATPTPKPKAEMPTFRVATSGNEVDIWLRESGSVKSKGQQIIENLRWLTQGLGLKLASVTVNGENIYSKEKFASSSKSLEIDACNEINKVI